MRALEFGLRSTSLGQQPGVLVEQVGAVDVNRLGELTGHLTRDERWGVDSALQTVLGLD